MQFSNWSPSVRRWLTGLTAVGVFSACEQDIIGPGEIEGNYELRLLNSQPLPYDHEGLGCCTYLNGVLILQDGEYHISVTARNRINAQIFTVTEDGSYSFNEEDETVAFTPGPVGSPFWLATGTVAPDSVRLSFGGEGPGSADQFHAVFVRVP